MSTSAEQRNRAKHILSVMAGHMREFIDQTASRMQSEEFDEIRAKIEAEHKDPDTDIRAMAMTPEDLLRITTINSLGQATSRLTSLVNERGGDIEDLLDLAVKIASAVDDSLAAKFAALDTQSDIDTSKFIVVQGSDAIN